MLKQAMVMHIYPVPRGNCTLCGFSMRHTVPACPRVFLHIAEQKIT